MNRSTRWIVSCFTLLAILCGATNLQAGDFTVTENDDEVRLSTPLLEAAIRKRGYVTGVYRQTFLDKTTGFRDAGFGLDIADWIMEPGSDKAYRDKLDPELVYRFGNPYHGNGQNVLSKGRKFALRRKYSSPK